MAGILQQLSGNPLSTPIGQRIERATEIRDHSNPDWTLIMEICDAINDTDEGPRDAIRAIKKRFQQYAGRDNEVVMSTLIVLETCVKNCGRRFHLLVTSKDFVQDLVKLIGPKNEPSPVLQEKVLNIIQTWVEAFRSQPELNGVVAVYRELKAKGIEFPQPDSDSMAPIHTPQRSAPISSSLSHHSAPSHHQQQQQQQQQQQAVSPPRATGPINLNSEQLEKLKNDLALVQENMSIFDSMLTEMTPGNEHLDDRVLLQELNSTCRQMQQRVVELIDQVTNEEITIELLRVNDELNNLFVRYDRFIKKHSPDQGTTASSAGAASSNSNATRSAAAPAAGESSLIDLDDEDSKPSVAVGGEQFLSRFSHMKVTGENLHKFKTPTGTIADSGSASTHAAADDFDQFAQSRSSTAAGGASAGASATASTVSKIPRELGESLLLDREEDLEEMAKWLKEHDSNGTFDAKPAAATRTSGNDTVDTGSDFDRFLLERAAAADRVNTGDSQTKPPNAKSDPFGL